MNTETEQVPLRLALHERTYQDVLTWLEDCDSELAHQVSEKTPRAEVIHRQITLPAFKWIEVCEGLYNHAAEFGGTWGRSADTLAQLLTSRIGGYFRRGLWIDDADCVDSPVAEKDATLHGLF